MGRIRCLRASTSHVVRPGFHIAQLNIALARAPIDSDLLSEFVALLDSINALADGAPGFVWRLQPEDGNSLAVRGFDNDRMIVNLSVWESIDHLATFVYRSAHTGVMRRRREWFDRIGVHVALWWVPAGDLPTVAEAEERLAHLQAHGPTLYAFTFKRRFLSGDRLEIDEELGCPA
ncbi:MAG: DUF3291 domain-containing protein [Solirubrobacterales bacterium]|nr:DUF3291 domain-containing protein [Solirubrobacterales bacterium]MBV9807179.1 DUF3291 domain-containing protein [Solirubrobacterales bacterium]